MSATLSPPSNWAVGSIGGEAGVWGVDAVQEGTTVYSGSYALKFPAGSVSAALIQDKTPAVAGRMYHYESTVRQSNLTDVISVGVQPLSSVFAALSTAQFFGALAATNTWTHVGGYCWAPANTRFIQGFVRAIDGGGGTLVGNVFVDHLVILPAPAFSAVYHNTTQSIASAASTTVHFNTADNDPGSLFDLTSTWTAPYHGLFVATTNLRFGTIGDQVRYAAIIRKNGTAIARQDSWLSSAGTGQPRVQVSSGAVEMNAGDTFDVQAFQDSVGAVNLLSGIGETWLHIHESV